MSRLVNIDVTVTLLTPSIHGRCNLPNCYAFEWHYQSWSHIHILITSMPVSVPISLKEQVHRKPQSKLHLAPVSGHGWRSIEIFPLQTLMVEIKNRHWLEHSILRCSSHLAFLFLDTNMEMDEIVSCSFSIRIKIYQQQW